MSMFSFLSFFRRAALALLCVAAAGGICAHGSQSGDITVDHPYALPTPPGAPSGALYVRTLKNTGKQPDRLVGARTPAARTVEIHHMQMDGNVMHMREVDGINLPVGAELKLRHGGEWHLMLVGLKAPLKNGDRIPVVLRFERAGEVAATAWVQQPRDAEQPQEHHH